jgi:amino acid permease
MTDKEKIAEKDTAIGCFGMIILVLLVVLFSVFATFSKHEFEIVTKEKIEPEQVLTTDGKSVDTLYIYKQK